jgi:hypothetical protein
VEDIVITEVHPDVNTWYHYPEKAQKFMVTAIDDHAATVEIQYFDGTIDEMDIETWYLLDIKRIETPENWTGPVDNIEKDDLNPADTEMLRQDWSEPYDEVSEKHSAGPHNPEDDDEGELEDDWQEDLSGNDNESWEEQE